MHSFGYRANALLTFAITILALMCAMASLSDNFNSPSPNSQVQVLNINWFQKKPDGDDEVILRICWVTGACFRGKLCIDCRFYFYVCF
ncbi:hypothetical protein CDL12_14975 [Handroanthus impetiginosus]|uniref:Signal peptidase complex subunit 3 n=1 Tax=Handroanthus impetiginosus TaxID=429701 RepID=A0A2G9H4H8_9LAMI|nr:hypothetical protein CDL12_14975 [Handroanthus impetiginosus]